MVGVVVGVTDAFEVEGTVWGKALKGRGEGKIGDGWFVPLVGQLGVVGGRWHELGESCDLGWAVEAGHGQFHC